MQSQPSQDPRDQAIRAALHDAGALAAIVDDEFYASCDGPARGEYLRVLGEWLSELGGLIEDGPAGTAVRFEARRITTRFGPVSGHR